MQTLSSRRMGLVTPEEGGRSSNLRYLNKRTMWTADTRLTGFTTVKAVEVPNGSGGVSEVLYFVNSAETWKLAWVDYGAASLLQASDPGGGTPVTVGLGNVDPFRTAYGFVTDRKAGAVAGGTAFTHEANALMDFVVTTRNTAGIASLRFRQLDAPNYWDIHWPSDGSVFLGEIIASVNANRATAAVGTIASGKHVLTVMDGQTITAYVDGVQKLTYGSAANFATATAGVQATAGTGGVISNIVTWPRVVTGAALTALNQLNP
jgi:hypothetical protein